MVLALQIDKNINIYLGFFIHCRLVGIRYFFKYISNIYSFYRVVALINILTTYIIVFKSTSNDLLNVLHTQISITVIYINIFIV